MPEAILEKGICEKCGVDLRENTLFCYNCGNRVVVEASVPVPESNGGKPAVDAETQAALDHLAAQFRIDEVEDDKLAKAAAERKKSRVNLKKGKEFKWEPTDDTSSLRIMLLAMLIAVVVAAIVYTTVFWK